MGGIWDPAGKAGQDMSSEPSVGPGPAASHAVTAQKQHPERGDAWHEEIDEHVVVLQNLALGCTACQSKKL